MKKLLIIILIGVIILLTEGCAPREASYATLVNSTNDQVVGVDPYTNSLVVIDEPHAEIHAGNAYYVHDTSNLANGDVWDIQIVTPASTQPTPNLIFRVESDSEVEWYFYEGVTIIAQGTQAEEVNAKRDSSNTPGMSVYEQLNTSLTNANAATNVTAATPLMHGTIGAGKTAGSLNYNDSFILRSSTSYDLRLIASAAGNVNIRLEWYEDGVQ